MIFNLIEKQAPALIFIIKLLRPFLAYYCILISFIFVFFSSAFSTAVLITSRLSPKIFWFNCEFSTFKHHIYNPTTENLQHDAPQRPHLTHRGIHTFLRRPRSNRKDPCYPSRRHPRRLEVLPGKGHRQQRRPNPVPILPQGTPVSNPSSFEEHLANSYNSNTPLLEATSIHHVSLLRTPTPRRRGSGAVCSQLS